MTLVSIAAGAFCALATLLHIASIAVVVVRVRRRMRPSAILAHLEGVSIVRPLCGIENFTEATLTSSFGLSYRRYEILFCVAQPNDPVIPVVQRLIDQHPEVPARLLIGNDRVSDNPKLNNVVKGWNAASYAWIVMSDSNVLMPADYLQELFGTWAADTGVCRRRRSEATRTASGRNSNARSSIPTRHAGNALPTTSAWASRRARPCSIAAT
jgi:ceramide glucosyltransferase